MMHSTIKVMYEQSAPQLRFEPCGFRRHNGTGIGNVHKILKSCGIHCKCNGCSLVYQSHEFFESPDPANKGDPAVRSRITDSEYRRKQIFLKD